ncbi:protein-disulfide reductase DsbD domain-containing protein [Paracoccus tegillarcae]|uniref:Thiol:disulfide interchange protein DsbD N-terminal domain-containing protein n=1 Tax=Paracoccus tegillarcae TaxID=1529068 RepID=A0A2K9ECZ3_9RHOB|nr:protein-disulfide reductase DsbD domain-containing protein [Paracoccus tegillarcae]AUH32790.1 hypothetical protein CUV01_04800 [Paracoccus tegillarcae]
MKLFALAFALSAVAAHAQDLPPGLTDARLLPGWTDEQGNRIAALELRLQPGWKTYWRSPGDSGIPPSFDWGASQNIGELTVQWPAPELIDSGGSLSFGFHDRLVLPFSIVPKTPGQPIDLATVVDFGLCENICVPAHLTLDAPPAANQPDPVIQTALNQQPSGSADQPQCRVSGIDDGLRLDLTLADAGWVRAIAVELPARPEVWISVPELSPDGEAGLTASADLVQPDGARFDLDTDGLVFTLIGDRPAVQMQGCAAT